MNPGKLRNVQQTAHSDIDALAARSEALGHRCDELLRRKLFGARREGGDIVVGRLLHVRQLTRVHNTS